MLNLSSMAYREERTTPGIRSEGPRKAEEGQKERTICLIIMYLQEYEKETFYSGWTITYKYALIVVIKVNVRRDDPKNLQYISIVKFSIFLVMLSPSCGCPTDSICTKGFNTFERKEIYQNRGHSTHIRPSIFDTVILDYK